jgi:hypothetical protein
MTRLLARAWPVLLAAVGGNAVVQALLVAPFVTPGGSVPFLALALASFCAIIGSLGVVVGRLRSLVSGAGRAWTVWAACLAVVLAVGLAALASSWLVPPTLTVVLILLAGIAVGRGAAGFVAFRHHPVRAILLTLVALLMVGLLWLGTLLLGFFITGWPAALPSWLAFGLVGVLLLTAWTSLASRSLSL